MKFFNKLLKFTFLTLQCNAKYELTYSKFSSDSYIIPTTNLTEGYFAYVGPEYTSGQYKIKIFQDTVGKRCVFSEGAKYVGPPGVLRNCLPDLLTEIGFEDGTPIAVCKREVYKQGYQISSPYGTVFTQEGLGVG